MQNDIDIFRGIKSEIQKKPENFKPAGQWLDGYCQNVIKKAKQHRKNLPQIISEKQKEAKLIERLLAKIRKEISKLKVKDKSEINEQEEEKISGLEAKKNQLSHKKHDLKRDIEHLKSKSQYEPGFNQLMSKAFEKASCEYPPKSRKIMLIAWLVTDKYLSESKLGITKYEQYVFNNEERESEGNGSKRLVSEQELAKDAVFARPEAMETVRDAYLSYENSSGKAENTLEGEWSNPMTKSALMKKVGIDGYKKFKTFAEIYGLRQAGNRQLWQIRIDRMDSNTKQKFTKT